MLLIIEWISQWKRTLWFTKVGCKWLLSQRGVIIGVSPPETSVLEIITCRKRRCELSYKLTLKRIWQLYLCRYPHTVCGSVFVCLLHYNLNILSSFYSVSKKNKIILPVAVYLGHNWHIREGPVGLLGLLGFCYYCHRS